MNSITFSPASRTSQLCYAHCRRVSRGCRLRPSPVRRRAVLVVGDGWAGEVLHANRVSGRSFSGSGETAFGHRRRPGTASEGLLLPSRECKPARRPRENAGYSSTLGKSWLASECVVGPGGLEPATRPLSAPAGKFRIRHGFLVEVTKAFGLEPIREEPRGGDRNIRQMAAEHRSRGGQESDRIHQLLRVLRGYREPSDNVADEPWQWSQFGSWETIPL